MGFSGAHGHDLALEPAARRFWKRWDGVGLKGYLSGIHNWVVATHRFFTFTPDPWGNDPI